MGENSQKEWKIGLVPTSGPENAPRGKGSHIPVTGKKTRGSGIKKPGWDSTGGRKAGGIGSTLVPEWGPATSDKKKYTVGVCQIGLRDPGRLRGKFRKSMKEKKLGQTTVEEGP